MSVFLSRLVIIWAVVPAMREDEGPRKSAAELAEVSKDSVFRPND
jgi:hypothetical protein